MGPGTISAVRAVFEPDQLALVGRVPLRAGDCAYGADDRHRLDIYGGIEGEAVPVVLFVHGGGFVQGDKRGEGGWGNAAVGRWAAESGFLGAVMNYRLAPDHLWPAGSEDVGLALDWLRANAAAYGGDPARIVLAGTSAGAIHVAGLLRLRPDLPVSGLVLLSGLYGYTPLDPKDERYYGPQEDYAARMPRDAVAGTCLPLLVACAEFDPPRFQAEFLGLMHDRLERHGAMPRAFVATGHNHYSIAMHVGTPDRRLSDEIAAFVHDVC